MVISFTAWQRKENKIIFCWMLNVQGRAHFRWWSITRCGPCWPSTCSNMRNLQPPELPGAERALCRLGTGLAQLCSQSSAAVLGTSWWDLQMLLVALVRSWDVQQVPGQWVPAAVRSVILCAFPPSELLPGGKHHKLPLCYDFRNS